MPLTSILETKTLRSTCQTTEKIQLICRCCRMSESAPVSAAGVTATTDPATAATRHPAAATSGGPTAAASAWASSKSGGELPPLSGSLEAATNSSQPT